MRKLLADRLMFILSNVETEDWVWFEEGLAYDNARLAQALIVTGISMGVSAYIEAGLKSLRWLMTLQTAPSGFFRPVGNGSFGERRQQPLAFDQQPLEATATISACAAAWRAEGDVLWKEHSMRVFGWFWERMTLVCLWWMSRQAIAAMASIPTHQRKPWWQIRRCAIYSASLKSGNSST